MQRVGHVLLGHVLLGHVLRGATRMQRVGHVLLGHVLRGATRMQTGNLLHVIARPKSIFKTCTCTELVIAVTCDPLLHDGPMLLLWLILGCMILLCQGTYTQDTVSQHMRKCQLCLSMLPSAMKITNRSRSQSLLRWCMHDPSCDIRKPQHPAFISPKNIGSPSRRIVKRSPRALPYSASPRPSLKASCSPSLDLCG